MANALIIKSGGGGLTVKSGGTFTVKDSGQPPYVIDGLEQSHWDVASAVVTGGLVDSIPDSSNVQALTVPSPLYGNGFVKGAYSAAGWQLNGKTLPTVTIVQGTGTDRRAYLANAWADKMKNYSGAMTVAMLLKPTYANQTGGVSDQLGCAWGWGYSGTDTESRQSGPTLLGYGDSTKWGFYRREANAEFRFSSGTRSASPQLWMVEYSNASNGANNYRFWIDGVLQSNTNADVPATRFPAGQVLSKTNRFSLGGLYDASNGFQQFAMNMAQAHIWKGALTDQQRTDVTAYLKSISGIA